MLNPLADELVEQFTIRYGYSSAPQAMAQELIQANLKIMALERQLLEAEHHASWGERRGRFVMRRGGPLPARQPKPQLADPISDDWIATGRE